MISAWRNIGSTVCSQSGSEHIERSPLRLASNVQDSECRKLSPKVRLELKIGFRGQFRWWTKLAKHRFEPSEQIRRTSLQMRLSEVLQVQVSHVNRPKKSNQNGPKIDHSILMGENLPTCISAYIIRCFDIFVSSSSILSSHEQNPKCPQLETSD